MAITPSPSIYFQPSGSDTGKAFLELPIVDDLVTPLEYLSFTRNTACDVIDIDGVSTEVAVNIPRYDYKEDYVVPLDNSYYSFDASTSKIVIPNYTFGSGDFTIIREIMTTDLSSVVLLDEGLNNSVIFRINTNGKLRIGKTAVGDLAESTTVLTALTKYTVAYVKEGSVGTYYVNGVAGGTTTDNFDYSGVNDELGRTTLMTERYYAALNYNLALTPQEVLDRSNGLPIPNKYKGANNVDVISGWDFTVGWANFASSTITDSNTFTSTASGGVRKNSIIRQGFLYEIRIAGTTTATTMNIVDYGNSVNYTNVSGSFDKTFTIDALDDGLILQNTTAGITDITTFIVVQLGNTLNLSNGKGGYGEEEVINGNFPTDLSGWTNTADVIWSAGKALYNGTSGDFYQGGYVLGKVYLVTLDWTRVSGELEINIGSPSVPPINSGTSGFFSQYIVCTVSTNFNLLSNSFNGTVDNVSAKEASTWYDLDHGIKAVASALLNNSTNFGNNFNGVSTCPSLLLEPSFTNYFLNSRTPVTQTVSGLSIGTEYTINCKNAGIITASETGGLGQGGTITEVYPFKYIATQTSILLTLSAGNSFEFVQLSNTDSAMNHVETLGVSVTKALDTASKTGLSSYIDSTSGSLKLEIAALSDNSTTRTISLSDGTTNNRVYISYSSVSNQIQFVVIVGGVVIYSHNETVADITLSYVCTINWASENFSAVIDDVVKNTQLSGSTFSIGVLTRLGFDTGSGAGNFFGRLKSLEEI